MKEVEIEAEAVRAAYRKYKAKLDSREKEVILRFYGITPHVRNSLAEIGEIFQLTRERIRQIKVDALKKLKPKKRKA
jgi:DNA-directed RNA polymerase sigma subunit (sigma70/sigma32)